MKKLFHQMIKFGLVGVICFVIDYITGLIVLNVLMALFTDAWFEKASMIGSAAGFIVSVIVNYILSFKFVFERKQELNRRTEFIVFVILSVIGLMINSFMIWIAVGPIYRNSKFLQENVGYNLLYTGAKIIATAVIAEEAGAIVRHEYMQGKGNVIRRMFREIDAKAYIMVDGDDTYPAEYGRKMVNCVLQKNADMVVGDRLSSTYFQENKRPFHNFGNSIVRASINFLFHTEIKDIMTGYRAFSFQFAKSFPVLSRGFEIETEMSIHAVDKNMQVENVVIEYRDRPVGSESKLNTYSDGMKVLKTIMRLFRTYKPLAYFGTIAAVLALLSVIFVIPVFSVYLKTALVPNFPTLIVCGFTMLAAILSLFTGLQLQNSVQKNRQDFEMQLIRLDHVRKDLEADYEK